jgi:tetratricopeptide (TPR) repeat protein
MPIELSLRFTSDEKAENAPIAVSLIRSDSGVSTPPAPFAPPLDDAALDDLRWYLELFSTWPTGPDFKRAEAIENKLEDWGRALRDSVIGGEAMRTWQQFVDAQADSKLVTIDATDPRVLRLPWELLSDDSGHIFAQGIGIRRRLQQSTRALAPSFGLPVRVLVLVSRPDDAGFIDPRAVSQPLLDALDALGARVTVEFLPEPTLAALSRRLRDRNAPPVHVVHFDGHGVYDAAVGLGYLLFENDKHGSDRVDANRLGTLLNQCGVPLMVLNACQSAAQQEANPYASVAARLIRAGVGSVLAMNYSVLVVAARIFVEAFYGGLADGLTIGQAVDAGRFALLENVDRHTLTRRDEKSGELAEHTVRLRDWFLPALYQQSADPRVFDAAAPLPEGLTPRTVPLALRDPLAPGGLPGEPIHGFHGRARELLALERAFADHRVVVLHGFGGQGKTTLAADAGRWFHRTGRFPGGAAFVSFEHGGSLQQLCSWVAQAVSGDPDALLGAADPVARVGELLREHPALLILDNFESALGSAPLLPTDELRAVLDAVWSWAGGAEAARRRGDEAQSGSRVLITTRDTNVGDVRFRPSRLCRHVPLGGLARDDALQLAAAVLDDHGIARDAIRLEELTELVENLGGHPLSLNLALPHLRDMAPAALAEGFEKLLPGFTQGAAQQRNESLAVSLEFSLRRLGQATRDALPDLAVFQGGAMEYDILAITQIDAELWKTARAELEGAALITVEPIQNIDSSFLRFHPTLAPYLAAQLPAERRAALETRFWQEYHKTANQLYQLDTQHPHEARAIARRELPNMARALDLTLAAGAHDEVMVFVDRIARFLDNFGRWRERDELQRKIAAIQFDGAGGITKAEYLRLNGRGEALRQAGRAVEAEKLFRDLLTRLEAGAAYDSSYDQAYLLWNLGRCLAAQGRPVQAIEQHRRALAGLEVLSATDTAVKQMIGAVHTDLADLHTVLGHYDDAENEYKAALVIDEKLGDDRGKGVDLGQLGSLALRRGDLAEAGRRYAEALETFQRLGEPGMEAVAWHQLGIVAQQARNWGQAERCYRESVRICEQIRDLPQLAKSFNQLALVAKSAGRLDEAERWYLRASEVYEELQSSYEQSVVLSNLANLYLDQGQLDQAERYARRAAAIKETLDLSAEPWATYNILAGIATARGRAAEAADWQRKEQDSYGAYAGAAHAIRNWQPVIVNIVELCRANAQPEGDLAAFLDQMGNTNDWRNAVAVIRRILAGERDIEKLRGELDSTDFVIVHTILAQLGGAVPTPAAPAPAQQSQPQPEAQQEGITLEQLFDLVAQACQPDAPAGLAAQLHAVTQGLATDAGMPAEVRALGRALNAVLSGDRAPDLTALPPQLAGAVRELVAQL